MLFIVMVISLWPGRAHAAEAFDWSCETALAPVPRGGVQDYADYIRLPSGSELFVRIERPRKGVPKRWILGVHGLLDSHRAWDGVAEGLIARGYGIVRPDLRGFARSLHDRHVIPAVIHYTENVRDIREAIVVLDERFGIKRPRLVGHSMGGGLVLALLGEDGIAPLVDDRHVIINPYVYRSEFYLAEKLNLAVHGWAPALYQMWPQSLIDAYVNPQLRRTFDGYIRDLLRSREVEIEPARLRRVIRRQVEVAIGTISGLRDLDGLDAIKKIPPGLRVDEVYGSRDDVVEPPLARKLGRKITERGGVLTELKGRHWLPEENPERIVDLIVD